MACPCMSMEEMEVEGHLTEREENLTSRTRFCLESNLCVCQPTDVPRPFHSLSCGTKQVHSTWGVIRSIRFFLGGTSVPAFLRLSLTACSADVTDPSKSSVTGPGFPESFIFTATGWFLIHSSCTCLDSWKFVEVHWTTVRAPLVCHIERFSCGI